MIAGIPYDWEIEYLESDGSTHIDTGYGILPEAGQTRIYSTKITSGNILVRNLVPVRNGNVGYMYDRVTRKLFGNAGTGNFVLGPDVARPVMGLRGMRKTFDIKNYPTDGLLAMWDAQGPKEMSNGYVTKIKNVASNSFFGDLTCPAYTTFEHDKVVAHNVAHLSSGGSFTAPINKENFVPTTISIVALVWQSGGNWSAWPTYKSLWTGGFLDLLQYTTASQWWTYNTLIASGGGMGNYQEPTFRYLALNSQTSQGYWYARYGINTGNNAVSITSKTVTPFAITTPFSIGYKNQNIYLCNFAIYNRTFTVAQLRTMLATHRTRFFV